MFSHWIWRVLAWVIALAVATGVALWIYKKQTYKALSYKVVSNSPLVPLQARGFADLKLFKGDKPIERPFLVTIRLTNIGDLNINASDFSVPLTIRPLSAAFFQLKPSKANGLGFTAIDIPYKGVVD